MKLNVKISERDKKVLLIAGIGIFLYCMFMWVVRPIFNQNKQISEEIAALEETKRESELKQLNLSTLRLVAEENEKHLKEKADMFYGNMKSTDVDRKMTGKILEFDLYPRELTIGSPVNTYLNSYYDMVNRIISEENEKEEPVAGLQTMRMSVAVSGEKTDVQKFLDFCINDFPKQRVTKYTFSGNARPESGNETILNMEIEWYVYDGLIHEDEEQ